MDYQAIYFRLIDRATDRSLECYTESHHVVPVCMGGADEAFNLVDLTPEEHFLAHKLLVKIFPEEHKLAFALLAMSRSKNGTRPNNKMFGWARRRVATAISVAKKGLPRPPSFAEKMRITMKGRKPTPEHRAKMSASHKGKKKTAEHLANISAALKGRHDIGMSGRKHSEETKAKMRAKALARKHTAETKKKMKAAYKSQTPAQRSARAIKAWETKRAKQMSINQPKE